MRDTVFFNLVEVYFLSIIGIFCSTFFNRRSRCIMMRSITVPSVHSKYSCRIAAYYNGLHLSHILEVIVFSLDRNTFLVK